MSPRVSLSLAIFMFTVGLLTVSTSCPAFAYSVEEGIIAYEEGEYHFAKTCFLKAVERGRRDEALFLEKKLKNKEGVSKGFNELAVSQEYRDAALYLGKMYSNGQGVSQDYDEAVKWFHIAIKGQSEEALNIVNDLYNEDKVGYKALTRGAVLYNRAASTLHRDSKYEKITDYLIVPMRHSSAEKGESHNQYLLGEMYRLGYRVPKNNKMALKWFRDAAEQEHNEAQCLLGIMYAQGIGVEQDYQQAISWFEKSVDHFNARAMLELGILYQEGKGLPKDFEKAVSLFQDSAERGYPPSQDVIALCYFFGEGIHQDYDKAFEWFKRSAMQGYHPSQFYLGLMYFEGRGIKKDLIQAYKWFDLAAAQNHPNAYGAKKAVTDQLTIEQLYEARKLSEGWQPVKE